MVTAEAGRGTSGDLVKSQAVKSLTMKGGGRRGHCLPVRDAREASQAAIEGPSTFGKGSFWFCTLKAAAQKRQVSVVAGDRYAHGGNG